MKNEKYNRLIRLLKGKWSFINYRKEFNGNFPINGWMPIFDKYWRGDIWQVTWRGYAISVDMRDNWIADMVNPNRFKG
jgi:uncharacterized protein YfbU (UPF0304 family)